MGVRGYVAPEPGSVAGAPENEKYAKYKKNTKEKEFLCGKLVNEHGKVDEKWGLQDGKGNFLW